MKRKKRKIVAYSLLALMGMSFLTSTIHLSTGASKLPILERNVVYAADEENKEDSKFAMTNIAQALSEAADDDSASGYFTDVVKPNDMKKSGGEAGALLGGGGKFLMFFTHNDTRANYMTIDDQSKAMGQYLNYGRALNQLGLDNTDDGGFVSQLKKMGRLFTGGITFLAYAASYVPNLLFKLVTQVGSMVNVFTWFGTAEPTGPFAPVIRTLASIYNGFKQMSVVFAVFIFSASVAFVFFGFSVTRNGKQQVGWGQGIVGAFWRLLLRLAVSILGPVILGMMFSGILANVNSVSGQSDAANFAIWSNFNDFQGWMTKNQLGVPFTLQSNGNMIYKYAGKEQPLMSSKTILSINDSAGHDNVAGFLVDSGNYGTSSLGNNATEETTSTWDTYTAGLNLLQGFMTSRQYTSADYEAEVQKRFLRENNVESNGKSFTTTIEGNDDLQKKYLNYILHESSLTTNGAGDGNSQYLSGNLSRLSLYNYLSTDFGDTSFRWVKSSELSQDFTTNKHFSVNFVSDGVVTAMGRYFLMLSLIMTPTIIGIVFGFAMLKALIGAIFKFFQVAISMAIGSFAQFVKGIVTVGVVGIELLGTAVFYQISNTLLIAFAQMAEEKISGQTGALAGVDLHGKLLMAGFNSIGFGIYSFAMSFALWFVAFQLIKHRSMVLKSIAEGIERSLDVVTGLIDPHATSQARDQAEQRRKNGGGMAGQIGNGADSGANGNKGGNSEGDRQRGAKSSERGIFGKMFNAKAAMADLAEARGIDSKNEDGSTKSWNEYTPEEKDAMRADRVGYLAQRAGQYGLDKSTGSDLAGEILPDKLNSALRAAGQDWESIQDAKISDAKQYGQVHADDVNGVMNFDNDGNALHWEKDPKSGDFQLHREDGTMVPESDVAKNAAGEHYQVLKDNPNERLGFEDAREALKQEAIENQFNDNYVPIVDKDGRLDNEQSAAFEAYRTQNKDLGQKLQQFDMSEKGRNMTSTERKAQHAKMVGQANRSSLHKDLAGKRDNARQLTKGAKTVARDAQKVNESMSGYSQSSYNDKGRLNKDVRANVQSSANASQNVANKLAAESATQFMTMKKAGTDTYQAQHRMVQSQEIQLAVQAANAYQNYVNDPKNERYTPAVVRELESNLTTSFNQAKANGLGGAAMGQVQPLYGFNQPTFDQQSVAILQTASVGMGNTASNIRENTMRTESKDAEAFNSHRKNMSNLASATRHAVRQERNARMAPNGLRRARPGDVTSSRGTGGFVKEAPRRAPLEKQGGSTATNRSVEGMRRRRPVNSRTGAERRDGYANPQPKDKKQ
jgi:hypothetical protein